MPLSAESMTQVERLLALRTGLAFPASRAVDLDRGVTAAFPGEPIEAIVAQLATQPLDSPQLRQLVRAVTIGETYFFRDTASFEALEHHILPDLIARRRLTGDLHLRFWSAGCSTGEEPYSLAILLDRLLSDLESWSITILATDINEFALESAVEGRYRDWSLRETPAWVTAGYFHPGGGQISRLEPRIQRLVTFAALNLVSDPYPEAVPAAAEMDLILCRNVLMYFTPDAQWSTIQRLKCCLADGGWLLVSAAEASVDLFRSFTTINFPGTTTYRNETTAGRSSGRSCSTPVAANQPEELPQPVAAPTGQEPPVPEPPASERVAAAQPPQRALPDLLASARSAADQGNLTLARAQCEQALTRDALASDALLLLADICQESGDLASARDALQRAIFLEPDNAGTHFALGALLMRGGHKPQARRSLETAIRLLTELQPSEAVDGADGLTAGRIIEMAHEFLLEMNDSQTRQAS